MLRHRLSGLTCKLAAGLLMVFCIAPSIAAAADAKKFALLVGINKYDHADSLPALQYAENDVIALAELLRSYGFKTAVLTETAGRKDKDLKPTKANIQKKVAEQLKKCGEGDLLVVGLSGHGMYYEEESYFCPQDARVALDKKGLDTLLSLKTLYGELGASKAAKVLHVEACRNYPKGGGGLTDKTTPPPPKNSVALFSCSIIDMKDGRCLVKYDDDIKKWLEPDQVFNYAVKTGDRVEGNWQNKEWDHYLGEHPESARWARHPGVHRPLLSCFDRAAFRPFSSSTYHP